MEHYYNNLQHGKWNYYNPDGTLLKTSVYKMGVLQDSL